MRTEFRSLTLVLVYVLLLLFPAGARAGDGRLDIMALGAPSFESFTARDGLPDGVLTTVGVDAEGTAWAASSRGLYRFLGHRWQRQVGPEHGTLYHRILLDRAGTLWAASNDKGLAVRDTRGWRFLTRADGLPPDIYRVTEMVDGAGRAHTWVLTNPSAIYERRGDRWVADEGNSSLPHGGYLTSSTRTTRLFGEPRQWIGTVEAGVWYRREGERDWHQFQLAGLAPGQIEEVQRTVDQRGEALWISAFGQGIYRIDEQGVRRWSVASGELPSNEVYSITIGNDAVRGVTAWVASRRGLVRVHGDVAEVFDRRYGLPSDQIRGTYIWQSPSGEEILWIATEGGVARSVFTAARWQTASLMGSGAVGVFGTLVENGPRGERLWVASNRDGLGLYEDGKWRRFSAATGDLPANDVRMIRRAVDLRGEDTLWAGLEPGYLVRVDEGPRFQKIPAPWPIGPGQAVMDIVARQGDGERELWIATRKSGIYRWRAGGWTAFRAEGVEGEWRVYDMTEQIDSAGRSWLWAGTNQGLARFDGRSWTLLRDVPGLSTRTLFGVTFPIAGQSRHVLWIGSALDGLTRLDVSNPIAPKVLPSSVVPAGIDVTVYNAVHDAQGRVYLCTNNGVQQLTPGPNRWSSRVFGRREGMVHEECNVNAQFVDAHGRFWAGTLGGLTVFDPGTASVGRPKALQLVEVRVDGRPVDPAKLRLSPDARELRLEYTLQSWQREAETRYRTELAGFDPRPGSWKTEPTRTFTALPPKRYRLRIEARDYAGVVARPLELAFEVLPTWWQRRAVQGAFGVGVLVLLIAVSLGRTRHLRAQKQHLENVVATRTEELNAANDRLVQLSYTDALTGLANRRRLEQRLHELLEQERAICSVALIDVDHFKKYNDQFGHPAGDVALHAIADSLLACAPPTSLVARYGGEEFACLFPGMPAEEAVQIAEQMRLEVQRRPIPVPGRPESAQSTISAGIAAAVLESEADLHQLLRAADVALYRAKSDGRNCVRT
ncbi:MAG TPA: diguanylate cyclase [Thermoanaerobaculia bacterium]|nr:diguanylate cyclase [Thermoanaerobaculia bacterium]